MEIKATAKYVRIAPRKLRLVADLIRGQRVEAALAILKFDNKKGAFFLEKTIKSALANAENKAEAKTEGLFIKNTYIDEGPSLKRFIPRAMGRATRIRKRTSHITVVLEEQKETNKPTKDVAKGKQSE